MTGFSGYLTWVEHTTQVAKYKAT